MLAKKKPAATGTHKLSLNQVNTKLVLIAIDMLTLLVSLHQDEVQLVVYAGARNVCFELRKGIVLEMLANDRWKIR